MQDIETPDNPDKGPSWPAGQAPSDINDSARAMMAGQARADLAAMARQDAARDILMAEAVSNGLMDTQEAEAGFPELLRPLFKGTARFCRGCRAPSHDIPE